MYRRYRDELPAAFRTLTSLHPRAVHLTGQPAQPRHLGLRTTLPTGRWLTRHRYFYGGSSKVTTWSRRVPGTVQRQEFSTPHLAFQLWLPAISMNMYTRALRNCEIEVVHTDSLRPVPSTLDRQSGLRFQSANVAMTEPSMIPGAELTKNPVEGFSAGLVDDRCLAVRVKRWCSSETVPHSRLAYAPETPPCSNLFEWAVTVLGPPDTLYEGGFFNAVLKFPKDYPQSPPEMRFTSEMWCALDAVRHGPVGLDSCWLG